LKNIEGLDSGLVVCGDLLAPATWPASLRIFSKDARRQLLASLTMISAIAVSIRHVSAQPTGTTAPSMPDMAPGMMTPQACIESCWRSHVMCLETERYCLENGGMHVMPTHLALLADCAEMCEKTANSLLRHSSQHAAVCIACAQLCDACAQECEAFKDDERMLLCARTCRDCAKHCREMSKLPI
jgi:hypothetical protein